MIKRFKQSFWFIVFTTGLASCISLIGGVGLESVTEHILPLVPLIVALPSLNTMVGDYAAIIAAHAGDPNQRSRTMRELAEAIAKAVLVNITGVLILSLVIAWRKDYLFEPDFILRFVIFVPFAMMSIIAMMFVITVSLDRLLERTRYNPDDILIPVVTSISDVLMLGLIAAAALVIF